MQFDLQLRKDKSLIKITQQKRLAHHQSFCKPRCKLLVYIFYLRIITQSEIGRIEFQFTIEAIKKII
ncbi:hypothetical protein AQ984_10945 [Clostridium pasteurianum]|nr:hypothetical protein AQ984_10945 [Clostridium pasteurianum]